MNRFEQQDYLPEDVCPKTGLQHEEDCDCRDADDSVAEAFTDPQRKTK